MFAVGTRTGVPNVSWPAMSLYATATQTFDILEIGITNTSVTACMVSLCRLTAQGTVGAGLTEANLSHGASAAACTAFTTHTGGTPALTDLGYRWSLGAAVGNGVIWTFAPGELTVLPATANGVGIYCPTGTGQALDAYFKWQEE